MKTDKPGEIGVPLERFVIQPTTYAQWCKDEDLPVDDTSRAVYRHWKRSIPKLQGIIDNIANGYLDRAHRDLGDYLTAFDADRFKAV